MSDPIQANSPSSCRSDYPMINEITDPDSYNHYLLQGLVLVAFMVCVCVCVCVAVCHISISIFPSARHSCNVGYKSCQDMTGVRGPHKHTNTHTHTFTHTYTHQTVTVHPADQLSVTVSVSDRGQRSEFTDIYCGCMSSHFSTHEHT